VLEATRPSSCELDWLISIDADDEEDMRERIECGVQGESFRRDGKPSTMRVTRIDARPGGGVALALPECCRVAAATRGALPEGAEVLWRVTPSSGRPPEPLERCLGGGTSARPYLVTAATAADARMLARALPPGSTWAAHLTCEPRRQPQFFLPPTAAAPPTPTPAYQLPQADEVAMLRDAGCQGLALGLAAHRWQRQPASAASARDAPGGAANDKGGLLTARQVERQLREWAAAVSLA
jgi:hypothetical protein